MATKKKTAAKKKGPAKATKPGGRKPGGRKAGGKPAPRKTAGGKAKAKAPAKRGGVLARKKKVARKVPTPEALRPSGPPENPRAHAMARKIAQIALDMKANDVVILDVRGMTSYADYFVVASGESDRQVSAIAERVQTTLKQQDGAQTIGTEGTDTGQWVLLDYGEVVAHLFFTEARAFYDLEGLWADAPREKLA